MEETNTELEKLRTENELLRRELKLSEEKYNFFLEKSPVGIILVENGNLIYTNPKFVQQLGYQTASELISKPIFDFISPKFKATAKKRMQKIVQSGGEAPPLEEQFIKKNGDLVDVLVLGKNIASTNNSLILSYIYDISELKKATKINLVFKTLFESAPDAIYILEENGKILSINDIAKTEIEISSFKKTENFKALNTHINWVNLLKKLESNNVIEIECEIPSADHTEINSYWRKFIYLPQETDKKQILCFSRNINKTAEYEDIIKTQNSELKQTKTELFKKNSLLESQNFKLNELNKNLVISEDNYRVIFNSVRDGIAIINPYSKKIKEANSSFLDLTGMNIKELKKLNFDDLFIESISLPEKENLKIGKRYYRIDMQNYLSILKNKKGNHLWVSLYMKYIKINHNTIILCLIQNIDTLERNKVALKQSQAIFRELSELSKTAIFMFDEEKFKYANPATSEITGYTNSELLNMPFWAVVHPDMQNLIRNRGVQRINGLDLPKKYQIKLLSKTGEIRWVDFTATKLGYPNENQALGNAVDITEMKRYEEKLIDAKLLAEQADKLKSAFLANMSHEIRTPMNGVIGFVQLLKEEINPERQKRFLNIIESSAEQLLNLINDILDLSKIESGQTKSKLSNFDFVSLLTEMFELFKARIENEGKEVNIKISTEYKEFTIFSDKKFITQILTNLLGNAFKFTDHGEINLGFTTTENFIKIIISDTGIGIPKDKKEVVFERFTQIHEDIKTKLHGTGLGLAISKKLVEHLGGKIYLESEVNIGTSFFVELPIKSKSW